LESKATEGKQLIITEKITLTNKKLELTKLQEKTETEVSKAIVEKRKAVIVMIQKEKEMIEKINKEEEDDADEDDDEDEQKLVAEKITERAKT
jgi:hypothetical protein